MPRTFRRRAARTMLVVPATLALALAPLRAQRPVAPPADDSVAGARFVDALLARMTRAEKFRQAFMAPGTGLEADAPSLADGIFGLQVPAAPGVAPRAAAQAHAARLDTLRRRIVAASRHGIPPLLFDEALHGLMREGATVFPQAIGLAATFDTLLVGRVHAAAARETRSRGIRMVLSPVVNLATDVRWGRTEETFGEDPWLVGAMGRAHVRAFESAGIVATAKHFVANVGDGGRDSWPVSWSARALEERFFPPFRSAIRDAGARAVMTAYNSVDGDPATQSRALLTTTLRERWGFGGIVISDASATSGATVLHRTEASTPDALAHAMTAGLDVVFQGGLGDVGRYDRAIADGTVDDATLDVAAGRVLRLKHALGLFDARAVDLDSAAHWNGHAEHRALARTAAARSLVLLHNASRAGVPTLPFGPRVRRVALIGPDADSVRLGGYAGPGIAPVSLRAALAARRGLAVRFATGPGRSDERFTTVPASALAHDGRPGLAAAYWRTPARTGAPALVRVDATLDFAWTLGAPDRALDADWFGARWTGTLTVPPGGARRLAIDGRDGVRVRIDGRLVLDRSAHRTTGRWLVPGRLAPGPHAIEVEFASPREGATIALRWDDGRPSPVDARIADAVAAARASDAAVVVVGIEEGEFRDRSRLALPGAQERLVRAVAATGVPTTVVIVGGSAVTMPWLDEVGAVLMAWYPGEEGGPAIADALVGDATPGGRLPITFPDREGQLPLAYDHAPTGRGDDYLDGSGAPLFPFGHGLSYTTFAWDSLAIDVVEPAAGPAARVRVTARIRNTGTRPGDEVVQLYLRDEITSVAQPLARLAGVARTTLAPGATTRVVFELGAAELALLDRALRRTVEPGRFRVMLGASSRDIRLRGTFDLR